MILGRLWVWNVDRCVEKDESDVIEIGKLTFHDCVIAITRYFNQLLIGEMSLPLALKGNKLHTSIC